MTALIDRVWKRHRRAEPSWASDDVAATWQLVSLLLDYPTDDLVCRAAELASVAAALLEGAHEQLRLDGYTLWTRETGDDTVAGWMTLSSEARRAGRVAFSPVAA